MKNGKGFVAFCLQQDIDLTHIANIGMLFDKYIATTNDTPLITFIEFAVCNAWHTNLRYITQKSKIDKVVRPRQQLHYLLRKYTKMSLANIGWRYGNVTHATVLNSCKTIKNDIETDIITEQTIAILENQIKLHYDLG
jgi:chromosomal replication initiator protein